MKLSCLKLNSSLTFAVNFCFLSFGLAVFLQTRQLQKEEIKPNIWLYLSTLLKDYKGQQNRIFLFPKAAKICCFFRISWYIYGGFFPICNIKLSICKHTNFAVTLKNQKETTKQAKKERKQKFCVLPEEKLQKVHIPKECCLTRLEWYFFYLTSVRWKTSRCFIYIYWYGFNK